MFPKLQEESKRLTHKERRSRRKHFEEKDETLSKYLCYKTINACYTFLKAKDFPNEQAILFLREPSIFYNRMFCHCCIYIYRSTQATGNSPPKMKNDNKDVDYLFLAHHAEHLISDDKIMNLIFSHLKSSHKILEEMEIGALDELKSV